MQDRFTRAAVRLREMTDLPFASPWRGDTELPGEALFPHVAVRGGYADCAAAVFRYSPAKRPLILADPHTYAFAGAELAAALTGAEPLILADGVKPSEAEARRTAERAAELGADAVATAGTGTLGDIGKRAARLLGLPYAIFPTGLSMNGFCSANASLYDAHGVKRSAEGVAPFAVGLAAERLPSAPARLLRAGIGDALCRPLCRFDMLLAHRWTGAAFDETPFRLMRAEETVITESLSALLSGKREAVLRFAMVLLLGGAAMNAAGSSAPASQAEHLLAHERDNRTPFGQELHGESVARCIPAVARLQRALTESGAGARFSAGLYLARLNATERALANRDPLYSAAAVKYKRELHLTKDSVSAWRRFREDLTDSEMKLTARLPGLLRAAGAPPPARRISFAALPLRRERFTCADLAAGLPYGKRLQS